MVSASLVLIVALATQDTEFEIQAMDDQGVQLPNAIVRVYELGTEIQLGPELTCDANGRATFRWPDTVRNIKVVARANDDQHEGGFRDVERAKLNPGQREIYVECPRILHPSSWTHARATRKPPDYLNAWFYDEEQDRYVPFLIHRVFLRSWLNKCPPSTYYFRDQPELPLPPSTYPTPFN